jgi:hypothetical protein
VRGLINFYSFIVIKATVGILNTMAGEKLNMFLAILAFYIVFS